MLPGAVADRRFASSAQCGETPQVDFLLAGLNQVAGRSGDDPRRDRGPEYLAQTRDVTSQGNSGASRRETVPNEFSELVGRYGPAGLR
jgi:hypothetical protein